MHGTYYLQLGSPSLPVHAIGQTKHAFDSETHCRIDGDTLRKKFGRVTVHPANVAPIRLLEPQQHT